MPEKAITRRQLVRLQTLWGLLARKEGFDPKDRALRLNWVGHAIREDVDQVGILTSFRDLTQRDAATAIEKIQRLLPAEMIHRRGRRGRKGRRGKKKPGAIAMDRARNAPTGAQLELIRALLAELGHDQAWLENWLAVGRSAPARRLATQRDADRIIPALKAMARRRNYGDPSEEKSGRKIVVSTPPPAEEEVPVAWAAPPPK
jgi:hypothetical protein